MFIASVRADMVSHCAQPCAVRSLDLTEGFLRSHLEREPFPRGSLVDPAKAVALGPVVQTMTVTSPVGHTFRASMFSAISQWGVGHSPRYSSLSGDKGNNPDNGGCRVWCFTLHDGRQNRVRCGVTWNGCRQPRQCTQAPGRISRLLGFVLPCVVSLVLIASPRIFLRVG
jgi:hypothetical protein